MPQHLLAVGDSYLPLSLIEPGLAPLGSEFEVHCIEVDPTARPELAGLHEYQGDPAQISAEARNAEVLLVHAAPVTAEIFDQNPNIRLVACGRGNPVNVDLRAAADRGITVLHTPAKNAPSVADLTMTFAHLLFRGAPQAAAWLRAEAAAGERTLDSTFVGGQWMAREPRDATIGIVGFGAIGRLVAEQAEFAGMRVLAYDPFLTNGDERLVTLDELLAQSDVITLHAKVSAENTHMINVETISKMKDGALLINTARQALVDEDALLDALRSGKLAGAALDVCEPEGAWPELVTLPNVMVTPHIGGATSQTQRRALEMLVGDIRRYYAGEEMRFVAAGPRTRVR